MNAHEFGVWLDSLGVELIEATARADMQTAREARRVAIFNYSSGSNSLADLAKKGHPYSRRAPQSRYQGFVNRQSGLFASEWTAPEQIGTSRGTYTSFYNASPEAVFIQDGTPSMVSRAAIVASILAEVVPLRDRNLSAAIDSVLRR